MNLRRMTETIPEMLWSASPDGAVDYCNARVLEYTGLAQDEIAGAGWMKMTHSDDAGGMERAWARSGPDRRPVQFEFRCFHAPDGKYRWCVSRACRVLRLRWVHSEVVSHGLSTSTIASRPKKPCAMPRRSSHT